MFVALAGMIGQDEEITVKITGVGKDGRMKVMVMPKAAKGANPALAQPLALAATPEELDAGFVTTLLEVGATRTGLAEQVAVTTTIMEAAKKTEAGKATKVLQSKGSSAPAATQSTDDTDDEHDDDADSGGDGNDFLDQGAGTSSSAPATPPTPPAPAPAPASNDDLLELF